MSYGHLSSSRRETKALTRAALIRSALQLLGQSSFDSISLREVTKKAGVSPAAFYRHFDDMEELGLVLVDQSFDSLRDMLRSARADPTLVNNVIDRSVEIVLIALRDSELHFRFIARERYGGVKRLRRAIGRELQLFADELAIDLVAFPLVRDWPEQDRRMLGSLVAETMIHMTAQLLDADSRAADNIVEQARRQLTLISTGVPGWSRMNDGDGGRD